MTYYLRKCTCGKLFLGTYERVVYIGHAAHYACCDECYACLMALTLAQHYEADTDRTRSRLARELAGVAIQ